MKRKFQFLPILTIFALFSPIAVFAVSSLPGIPLLVYGEVTINDQAAPIDTEISAEIDSIKVATVNITNAGRYFIEVPDGKVNEGKMITFKVNGITNNSQLQCVNIDITPFVNFNLAVTIVSSSPSPSPSPTSGGGGGGGGGGVAIASTPIPTSTPTPLTAEQQKVDANKDNKIDVLDFNTLMVNWGKTTANNVADFNGDGKVDVFDFNLLMINWTL